MRSMLASRLTARPSERLALACDDPRVPGGPENLVLRAADALRRRAGDPRRGAALRLRKAIPVAGGMGGGSSDAAGALVLLDRLWNLGLASGEIGSIAAELGSALSDGDAVIGLICQFVLRRQINLNRRIGDNVRAESMHGQRVAWVAGWDRVAVGVYQLQQDFHASARRGIAWGIDGRND